MNQPPPAQRVVPAFSPQRLMELYLRGQHDALSVELLAILHHFSEATYSDLDAKGQRFVSEFVKNFLTLFTQSDYIPARPHLLEMVALGATVSNLVAMSSFGTTDAFLALLGDSPADRAKALVLHSARTARAVDRKALFDADPLLASIWYGAYAQIYNPGMLRGDVAERLLEHFRAADGRLDVSATSIDAYFASTYVGHDCDRAVKTVINASMRRGIDIAGMTVRNRPDARKVAVVSGNWWPGHSVYRICRAFVESLDGYHRTLIRIGSKGQVDTSGFDRVVTLDYRPDGRFDASAVLDNDFALVYYPDVGLKPASILLSNLRLAPVQITTTGHPVSTFGSEIDYYISGAQTEPPDAPERHYTERLVLLPGCGVVHERPLATPTGRKPASDPVVLNCPWNAQKLNHAFAETLREALSRARRPVRLRLFVNASLDRRNDLVPFLRDVETCFGSGRVEVVRGLPYPGYMARMEEGLFSVDSHPFGGCNTVADSLWLRRLVVCWDSDYWYGRIGPWMVRQAGLPELAVTTRDAFVASVARLVDDEAYRVALEGRLESADLEATVFARDEARAFRRAVDFLLANHDRLRAEPDRSPIRVG